jgi:uncharacterized membrane protein (DUF2068 family)
LKGHRFGLHFIAVFEAFKGLLVLAAGVGLLQLLKKKVAENGRLLFIKVGLNPDKGYPQTIVQYLAQINDGNIILIAVLATCYAFIRFFEAYGLWRQRAWAKWLAIVSGAIYLPFEFVELYKSYSDLKLVFTLANIAVVAYLVIIKVSDSKVHSAHDS